MNHFEIIGLHMRLLRSYRASLRDADLASAGAYEHSITLLERFAGYRGNYSLTWEIYVDYLEAK